MQTVTFTLSPNAAPWHVARQAQMENGSDFDLSISHRRIYKSC